MKTLAILLSLILALLAGCNDTDDSAAVAEANRATVAADHAAAEHPAGAEHPAAAAQAVRGEVVETMDAAGYTYVQLATESGRIWAAGPKAEVAVGEIIELPQGMLMTDFPSKELDRTFDEIWFVGGFVKPGADGGDMVARELQSAHAGLAEKVDETIQVAKASGGQTVAQIYALNAGDDVLVRGKVVKANYGILGTNWYHVQDGSGDGSSGDLTVTSDVRVKVGDVVLVKGKLSLDRDFGAGYRYDRIVEGAELTADSM